MEKEKIDMFMMTNAEMFPATQINFIREKLAEMPDDKANMLYAVEFRKPMMVLLVSIFLGYLGIDRFLIGDTGLGVGKLLTAGGCGAWQIVDWFLISDATKEYNFKKFMMYV